MNKLELLKETIEKVDKGMFGTVGLVEYLEQHGIEDGMHVGQSKEFFEDNDKVIEWYLGQFINIINKESWFAMNSLINSSSAWMDKTYE